MSFATLLTVKFQPLEHFGMWKQYWNAFSLHTPTLIKNKQIHAATHYLQYTIRHKHRHSLCDFLFCSRAWRKCPFPNRQWAMEALFHGRLCGGVTSDKTCDKSKLEARHMCTLPLLLPASTACPVITLAAKLHSRCIVLVNVMTGMLLSADMHVLCTLDLV